MELPAGHLAHAAQRPGLGGVSGSPASCSAVVRRKPGREARGRRDEDDVRTVGGTRGGGLSGCSPEPEAQSQGSQRVRVRVLPLALPILKVATALVVPPPCSPAAPPVLRAATSSAGPQERDRRGAHAAGVSPVLVRSGGSAPGAP